MHPIFSEFRRLAMYLVVWLFIGLLLAYLLTLSHDISPRDALVLALPLCLFYSFLCLSAWYSCRGRLPDKFTMGRLLATHITTGFFAAIIWTFAAAGLAHGLSKTTMFAGLSQRFRPEIPLIFCTGILLYLLSVAFYYIVISFEASRDAEARVMKASVLARDAELKALKAQVNPHFLFNSLNSISALTSSDPAKAREMCLLLADFLRMTLGLGEKTTIPLSEELTLLHRFLAIEKVRFGSRLQMTENITDDCKNVLIPPLLLQPLVENAVKHGIANLPEGGQVHLAAECENGRLSIEVKNTFDPEATPSHRNGMGLANVRQRLDARYPKLASMRVNTTADQFQVNLSLPAEPQEIAS